MTEPNRRGELAAIIDKLDMVGLYLLTMRAREISSAAQALARSATEVPGLPRP